MEVRKIIRSVDHSSRSGGVKTEHLTQRSTHAFLFFVARRVAQLFHISRFIQCTCIGSRLDESSQHVCRVLKTVRLLHSHSSISCLVATSWASLSVVPLILTDWRRNQGSPAEWLKSHRSQKVSVLFYHQRRGNLLSLPCETTVLHGGCFQFSQYCCERVV